MNSKLLKKLFKKNGYQVLDITLCDSNEFAIVTVKDVFVGGKLFRQYFFNQSDIENSYINKYGIECINLSYKIFGLEETFKGVLMK